MPIRAEMRARYPKDWKLRSYFVRFVRARGICEWCGAKHGEPHPITRSIVVLTTAHIHDDRPEASSLLNLAALCQKCHNGHDMAARRAGIRERNRLHTPDLFDAALAGKWSKAEIDAADAEAATLHSQIKAE